ncbi:hypothetical protein ABB22_12885 [Stenotrophomonas nitritireducens]|uniref:Uncharacterized protein n=1 Tax=Stenotrophomonas nitritireducens TaxID=83617 RepID=A0ABR5NI95_9GAMM|nr:hypothetical protein ABB22_12885 [Stenotrophomonas nitritireducens]
MPRLPISRRSSDPLGCAGRTPPRRGFFLLPPSDRHGWRDGRFCSRSRPWRHPFGRSTGEVENRPRRLSGPAAEPPVGRGNAPLEPSRQSPGGPPAPWSTFIGAPRSQETE